MIIFIRFQYVYFYRWFLFVLVVIFNLSKGKSVIITVLNEIRVRFVYDDL